MTFFVDSCFAIAPPTIAPSTCVRARSGALLADEGSFVFQKRDGAVFVTFSRYHAHTLPPSESAALVRFESVRVDQLDYLSHGAPWNSAHCLQFQQWLETGRQGVE